MAVQLVGHGVEGRIPGVVPVCVPTGLAPWSIAGAVLRSGWARSRNDKLNSGWAEEMQVPQH